MLAGYAPWNNLTHAICSGTDVEYPAVFQALCKETCASATVAPTPAPDAAAERPDEADAEGAIYPDRRLVSRDRGQSADQTFSVSLSTVRRRFLFKFDA